MSTQRKNILKGIKLQYYEYYMVEIYTRHKDLVL